MEKEANQYFDKYLNFLREKNLYPSIYAIEGPSSSPEIFINNKKFLTFSSNNYLGIADNAEIKKIVIDSVKKYGIGSGSTRLLSGTLKIQLQLERILAEFFGFEDTITFSSGFLANIGTVRMLVDPFPYFILFKERPGVIISDELNHASIIDAVRLAKSERIVYRHNDISHLEDLLVQHRKRRKLIVTDGVFSMDGDLARLKEIGELARIYNTLLMIDDSHGVGVLGPHGEGTAHHIGAEKDVDVVMGSFTKAFGSIGGFVSTNQAITDYLRVTARSYIFSDPIPPALVAGLIEAIKIIKKRDNLRQKVLDNAQYLRDGLKSLGFEVLGEETPIVPLMVGSENNAIRFADLLCKNGILAPSIRRPAVILGKERIRFSVMALHTKQQIDLLLSVCEDIGISLKLI